MKMSIRVIVALSIVILAGSTGASLFKRMELRTPGTMYNDSVLYKMDRCMDAQTKKLRDVCFIISGITI